MDKNKKPKKGTIIHGIAASEHLDSSGERIEIKGIDISSLTVDGMLNFEHKSEQASQMVGKILSAKKIFEASDCENDSQRYFWDKIKTPYLYITGELFDAVGHQGAKDVAAMLRYDGGRDEDSESRKLINFSIEGQKLEKRGSIIKKCIARKVSITLVPCNKVCEAEELKETKKENIKKSDRFSMVQDLMQMNKNEKTSSCQIMTKNLGFTPKRVFAASSAPDKVKAGDRIINDRPRPKTGKDIYGTAPKFSGDGRKISDGTDPKAEAPKPQENMKEENPQDPKERVAGNINAGRTPEHASTARPFSIIKNNKRAAIVNKITKSLTAGGMGGMPGAMAGGAALQKEDLSVEMQAVCEPKMDLKKDKKKKKKKSDSSSVQKGENGNWKKEGYTIKHSKPSHDAGDGNYNWHTVTAHDKKGKEVGRTEISASSWKGKTDGVPHVTHVEDGHRRKGIASAMYSHAEKHGNMKLNPDNGQSRAAQKLWSQKNRPFGKSELPEIIKFVQSKYPQMEKSEQIAIAKTIAVIRKTQK